MKMLKKTLFDTIPKNKHSAYLKDLLDYVVEKNGLANLPKPDIEASFVYFYKKHVNPECGIYTLSSLFKTKQSKIKSLMEVFLLKFDNDDSENNEINFLKILENAKFQIESIEKVEINFHFDKFEYSNFIQDMFRKVNGSITINKASEKIIVNQNRLYDVLNSLWEPGRSTSDSDKNRHIQKIIGNLGKSIDEEMRKKLRDDPNCEAKIKKIFEYGSHLASIGGFVSDILKSILTNVA